MEPWTQKGQHNPYKALVLEVFKTALEMDRKATQANTYMIRTYLGVDKRIIKLINKRLPDVVDKLNEEDTPPEPPREPGNLKWTPDMVEYLRETCYNKSIKEPIKIATQYLQKLYYDGRINEVSVREACKRHKLPYTRDLKWTKEMAKQVVEWGKEGKKNKRKAKHIVEMIEKTYGKRLHIDSIRACVLKQGYRL